MYGKKMDTQSKIDCLDGSPTDIHESILGFGISSQQITAAVGTSFAFVARAFLIFATSTAYIQIFWRAAKHPVKQNTLEDLDTIFSGLSNILTFRKGSVWQKLLPIAFVIPPGTLSVVLVSGSRTVIQNVPNVDFTSFNYVAGIPFYTFWDSNIPQFLYNGLSVEVEKVAVAVAAQGAILPIAPPAENSSWALDFYGPSLNCGTMKDSVRSQVEPNIVEFLNNTDNCHVGASTYLCWNPGPYDEEPVVYTRNTTPLPFPDAEFLKGDNKGPFTPIYIALLPSVVTDPCGILNNSQHQLPSQHIENASFFQCDLHNASYHVDFAYKSGVQNIAVEVERLEAVANVFQMYGPANDLGERLSPYDHLNNCDRLEEYEPLADGPCVFNTSLLKRLSYTGILDGFRRLAVGSVSIAGADGVPEVDTSIFATSLMHTPELQYLLQAVKDPRKETTLQNQYTLNKTSRGAPLSNVEEISPRSSLPRAMEELFRNVTISLMSSDLLQPNLASPFAPPPVNVTFTTLNSVYSYSPARLLIAYGTAILVTSLALAFGIVAILPNNASYSSDFSTILRATYGAVLSVPVQPQDMDGASPLPKYLGTAKVSWSSLDAGKNTMRPKSSGENLVNHIESDSDQNVPSIVSENITQVEQDMVQSDAAAVSTGDNTQHHEVPRGSKTKRRYINLPSL
ncbi:hypothetical protein EKO27_g10136 [Xylaria grammica]|uniref:Uncharacterized protein n=1 Tax=Xylaria grammica TaxID=363999 RepID=A0A439CS93_9PEZI|nr:hypothetical protein EKO27_g10136 [Xylaria grammica]